MLELHKRMGKRLPSAFIEISVVGGRMMCSTRDVFPVLQINGMEDEIKDVTEFWGALLRAWPADRGK